MDDILLHKEKLNKIYIKYHTNINYDADNIDNTDNTEHFDTNCHITKKLLVHLLECKSSEKKLSNFQTIYFEYKNIGHSCCIYKNKILQSFAKYHYLKYTDLSIGVEELFENIDKYIYLFYPDDFLNLDKEDNLYVSIKYYYTDIDEKKIIYNLNKLLSHK
jgi:hypothetical protein